jgi:hypothetical protein
MTDILLLEGPDGNRYKATQCPGDIWYVEDFLNMKSSDWALSQRSALWWSGATCTTEKLKETFSILAAGKTDKNTNWEYGF